MPVRDAAAGRAPNFAPAETIDCSSHLHAMIPRTRAANAVAHTKAERLKLPNRKGDKMADLDVFVPTHFRERLGWEELDSSQRAALGEFGYFMYKAGKHVVEDIDRIKYDGRLRILDTEADGKSTLPTRTRWTHGVQAPKSRSSTTLCTTLATPNTPTSPRRTSCIACATLSVTLALLAASVCTGMRSSAASSLWCKRKH